MTKPIKTDQPDYEVGYQKPPKATQFVKGQSGNPSGRPKGKRNLATMLNAALHEKVTVNDSGTRKTITKLEATFKQIVNKAAAGDNSSTKLLIQMFPFLDALLDDEQGKPTNAEADRKVVMQMQKRLLAAADKAAKAEEEAS